MAHECDRWWPKDGCIDIEQLLWRYSGHWHYENSFHQYYWSANRHEFLNENHPIRNRPSKQRRTSVTFLFHTFDKCLHTFFVVVRSIYIDLRTRAQRLQNLKNSSVFPRRDFTDDPYLLDVNIRHVTVNDEGEVFVLQMLLEEEFHKRFFRSDTMQKNIETSSASRRNEQILFPDRVRQQTLDIETILRIHGLVGHWSSDILLSCHEKTSLVSSERFDADHRLSIEEDYSWMFSFCSNRPK